MPISVKKKLVAKMMDFARQCGNCQTMANVAGPAARKNRRRGPSCESSVSSVVACQFNMVWNILTETCSPVRQSEANHQIYEGDHDRKGQKR